MNHFPKIVVHIEHNMSTYPCIRHVKQRITSILPQCRPHTIDISNSTTFQWNVVREIILKFPNWVKTLKLRPKYNFFEGPASRWIERGEKNIYRKNFLCFVKLCWCGTVIYMIKSSSFVLSPNPDWIVSPLSPFPHPFYHPILCFNLFNCGFSFPVFLLYLLTNQLSNIIIDLEIKYVSYTLISKWQNSK